MKAQFKSIIKIFTYHAVCKLAIWEIGVKNTATITIAKIRACKFLKKNFFKKYVLS